MKKTSKSNPLKTFNDNKKIAYKKAGSEMSAFKKSLIKKDNGGITLPPGVVPPGGIPQNSLGLGPTNSKPISANFNAGKISGGFSGSLGESGINNTNYRLGYNNMKQGKGLNLNAGYSPNSKNVTADLNYNTTIGKNKIPLKVGVSYGRGSMGPMDMEKKGGSVKRKKK